MIYKKAITVFVEESEKLKSREFLKMLMFLLIFDTIYFYLLYKNDKGKLKPKNTKHKIILYIIYTININYFKHNT